MAPGLVVQETANRHAYSHCRTNAEVVVVLMVFEEAHRYSGTGGTVQTAVGYCHATIPRGGAMPTELLHWALIALVVALVAAVLGFGGIAGTAAGIAKLLFWIFVVIAVAVFVMHLMRGRSAGPRI